MSSNREDKDYEESSDDFADDDTYFQVFCRKSILFE